MYTPAGRIANHKTHGQRGKHRNGALETPACSASSTNSGNAPAGLDKIRTFSRRRTIATLMIYVDEHDRQQTEKTLGALVAGTLTS